MVTPDQEETARLILMDMESQGLSRSAVAFTRALRQEYPPGTFSALDIANLWSKYRGFDGRSTPTHDVYTGERIRK